MFAIQGNQYNRETGRRPLDAIYKWSVDFQSVCFITTSNTILYKIILFSSSSEIEKNAEITSVLLYNIHIVFMLFILLFLKQLKRLLSRHDL